MTIVSIHNKIFSQLENVTITLGLPFLCEVGKIKIGRKGAQTTSKKGKVFRMPEKLDRFIITTNFKDPNTDTFIIDHQLMEKIASETNQNADNLKFLPVMLLFDDPKLNFLVRFSCYKGATAWCVGDGRKAFRLKTNNGEREQVECPCERVLPDYDQSEKEKCKIFGRLSVLLQSARRLGGVWVFRTGSWNTVKSIQSSMAFLRHLTGGVLAGIPLTLTINPKTVVTPKGEVRTIYVVNLEYWGDMEQLLQHAMQIQKRRIEYQLKSELLEEQLKQKLGSLPPVQFDEDDRDIAEEFFAENIHGVETEEQEDTHQKAEEQAQPNEGVDSKQVVSQPEGKDPTEKEKAEQKVPERLRLF